MPLGGIVKKAMGVLLPGVLLPGVLLPGVLLPGTIQWKDRLINT